MIIYPRKHLHLLNASRCDLFPIKHKILAANRSPITLDGAMFVRIKGCRGEEPTAAAMMYVSLDVDELYLSKQVMKEPQSYPNHSQKRQLLQFQQCSWT